MSMPPRRSCRCRRGTARGRARRDRPHRLAVPGIAADHERRHGLQAASTDAVSAPLQASPQPIRPSSASMLTRTSVTPSRATCELTSRCMYGTLTVVASTRTTLIGPPPAAPAPPPARPGRTAERLPAVDHQRLARHVLAARSARRTPRATSSGVPSLPQRRALAQAVVPGWYVAPLAHVARRGHVAGRHRVDADAVGAERWRPARARSPRGPAFAAA